MLETARSVFRIHVLAEVDRYTTRGRQPPSDTDCRVLTFGQIREAIMAADDPGMHDWR